MRRIAQTNGQGGQGGKGGKGGKGLGKAYWGSKRARAKRNRELRETRITDPVLRRIMRAGGGYRVASDAMDRMRLIIDKFLDEVVKKAMMYAENCGRCTMTATDVLYALKSCKLPLYL